MLELLAAAANEPARPLDLDRGQRRDVLPGLRCHDASDAHAPFHNQAASLRPRDAVAIGNDVVEAKFHLARRR